MFLHAKTAIALAVTVLAAASVACAATEYTIVIPAADSSIEFAELRPDLTDQFGRAQAAFDENKTSVAVEMLEAMRPQAIGKGKAKVDVMLARALLRRGDVEIGRAHV